MPSPSSWEKLAMGRPAVAAPTLQSLVERWPTPKSMAWTRGLLEQASLDENVLAVIAIGSAVRPGVRSLDLDIVMISREPVKPKTKPPVEVDLRSYLAAAVEAELAKGDDLLGWAIKFGRVLFEREGFWSALVESWKDRVPLPSPDVARRRADDAYARLKGLRQVGDADAAREQAVSYLTHLGRYELLKRSVYPASRPELPGQLRATGVKDLADWLEQLLSENRAKTAKIIELIERDRS